jgi:predicted DCC family thiol-disulfide oxidoreductase YuxK
MGASSPKVHERSDRARRLDILYDGGCAFCVRVLRWMKRADVRGAFRLVDARDPQRVAALFPQIDPRDAAEAMLCVTPSGQVLRGFYAFRRMIWCSPWLVPLVPVFYLPGAGLVGPRLYAWVARSRRRFGCRPDRCETAAPKS